MLPAMEHDQLWGWMAQLYSIRSAGSWGVGDFEDLKTLMVDSHSKTGADFMLVNPLHACEPVAPLTRRRTCRFPAASSTSRTFVPRRSRNMPASAMT